MRNSLRGVRWYVIKTCYNLQQMRLEGCKGCGRGGAGQHLLVRLDIKQGENSVNSNWRPLGDLTFFSSVFRT